MGNIASIWRRSTNVSQRGLEESVRALEMKSARDDDGIDEAVGKLSCFLSQHFYGELDVLHGTDGAILNPDMIIWYAMGDEPVGVDFGFG